VVANIISDTFDKGHVAVVQGGRKENEALLEQRFDYIFFTGSVEVGRIVMEKASKHLTPVSLELGGKSPAIVDSTADVALAAKRIAFGKFLNLSTR
jgi:aldehyde dehydrogenase (NAD+)